MLNVASEVPGPTLGEVALLIQKLPPEVQALRLVRVQVDYQPGAVGALIQPELAELIGNPRVGSLELQFEAQE